MNSVLVLLISLAVSVSGGNVPTRNGNSQPSQTATTETPEDPAKNAKVMELANHRYVLWAQAASKDDQTINVQLLSDLIEILSRAKQQNLSNNEKVKGLSTLAHLHDLIITNHENLYNYEGAIQWIDKRSGSVDGDIKQVLDETKNLILSAKESFEEEKYGFDLFYGKSKKRDVADKDILIENTPLLRLIDAVKMSEQTSTAIDHVQRFMIQHLPDLISLIDELLKSE